MSLDRAIAQLEAEISLQGTSGQPAEGTTDWYLFRAKALGLSALRRMRQLGAAETPAAAERYYRNTGKLLKTERDEGP